VNLPTGNQMKNIEEQYLTVLSQLVDDSPVKHNRTGVDTWEQPGVTLKADLSLGFPVLTTKKIAFKNVISELLWFIKGDTNIEYLHKHGNHIWDEWADENGNLGPVYGAQWRAFGKASHGDLRYAAGLQSEPVGPLKRALEQGPRFIGGVDQLANAIDKLKNKPDDRRIIVSAWNPLEEHLMRLPPCHMIFQFLVSDGKLHTIMMQRSADWFLGVPFNIASYALLTHIVAKENGWDVGTLTMTFGSAHLYVNHEQQARTQLQRDMKALPKLVLEDGHYWDTYEPEHIKLEGYDPHPFIKAEVAV
jgi:thymidylate synthase